MAKTKLYLLHVITMGLLVTVLYSSLLIAVRGYYLPKPTKENNFEVVSLSPSGLTPEFDTDPNYRSSYAWAMINPFHFWERWGFCQDTMKVWGQDDLLQYGWTYPLYSCEFDRDLGLIITNIVTRQSCSVIRSHEPETKQMYAGPEGVFEEPNLSRFSADAIMSRLPRSSTYESYRYIVYDPALHRFFLFDPLLFRISKGPVLPETFVVKDLQTECFNFRGDLIRNEHFIDFEWNAPQLKTTKEPLKHFWSGSPSWLQVLEPSGNVSLLNTRTLEFEKYSGILPKPQKDCLAHGIQQVCDGIKQVGLVACSLTSKTIALDVYPMNQDGTLSNPKHVEKSLPTSTGAYVLESMQGPLWGLVSFFATPGIDAVENQRAIFILGDSFEGELGRTHPDRGIEVMGPALAALLPSLLLSGILARLAIRNAKTLGFSRQACLWWHWGICVLGLPAYITYRLTRPRMVMVTCVNCGKLRRPDWDHCQHCGSPWQVPDLAPPAWRVLAVENAPA